MLWESFDTIEEQKQRLIAEKAEQLKHHQEELTRVREEAKNIAYAEALDKASEDFVLKKDNAIKELTAENAQQMVQVQNMIQESVKEQAMHYAKLLTNILGFFIPHLCERKSFAQISHTLSFILEGCDKRQLTIGAHPKTLEQFLQYVTTENTKRIETFELNNLKEGLLKVTYEGGGTQFNLDSYQRKIVTYLSGVLGYEISLDKQIEDEAQAEIEILTEDSEIFPETYDILDDLLDDTEEVQSSRQSEYKSPLFQDFEEESGEIEDNGSKE